MKGWSTMTDVMIAVIDRNALFRAGLVSLLSSTGFDRVDGAADVEELKRRVEKMGSRGIVLWTLSPTGKSPADAMTEIQAWAPQARVIFLSGKLDMELLSGAYAAGAAGFLLEDISQDALRDSLRLVLAGEKVFPSRLAEILGSLTLRQGELGLSGAKPRPTNLSDRELEILRCLAKGEPNKVIAANLEIAESTVKVHLKSILRKIHVENRTQAAVWTLAAGLADIGAMIHASRAVRGRPQPLAPYFVSGLGAADA
jgi:two-component system nitrate/nitrite response regulator NarL